MGVLISIFAFIWRALKSTLTFILSIPGMIVSAFVGVATFVSGIVSDVGGVLSRLSSLLDSGQSYVDSFLAFVQSESAWGLFYQLFAFDVFGEVLSYFLSFSLVAILLVVFQFVFHALVVAVPFLVYKCVGKILQAVSAGFAKPA